MHPYACQEARIGWCANSFGFFREAYESLFEKQPDLEKSGPIKLVARNDDEAKKLQACSETSEARMGIQRDIDEGIRLNIKSTPTFFINGRRVEGSYPPYIWTQIIQELLKTKP
jgi:protein-disulfide isomerase